MECSDTFWGATGLPIHGPTLPGAHSVVGRQAVLAMVILEMWVTYMLCPSPGFNCPTPLCLALIFIHLPEGCPHLLPHKSHRLTFVLASLNPVLISLSGSMAPLSTRSPSKSPQDFFFFLTLCIQSATGLVNSSLKTWSQVCSFVSILIAPDAIWSLSHLTLNCSTPSLRRWHFSEPWIIWMTSEGKSWLRK